MQIINCEQGTEEWFNARLGVVTASRFKDATAGGGGKTRLKYMRQKVGEILTGRREDTYSNAQMEKGHECEPIARNLYELQSANDVEEVGFIKNGRLGCSPDGIVGDDGLIEIKTRCYNVQIETLESGKVPSQNVKQIQGSLMVADRKWCDYISYCEGLPLFVKRVERDEGFIKALRADLELFVTDLDDMTDKIKGMY